MSHINVAFLCGMKRKIETLTSKRSSYTITGLDRHWGLQQFTLLEFLAIRHMKVIRLSALSTGRLYPQEISLVLIPVRDWVDLRAIVWPEEMLYWKIPMTPAAIHQNCVRNHCPQLFSTVPAHCVFPNFTIITCRHLYVSFCVNTFILLMLKCVTNRHL
jgi:hypothetical protein